MKKESPTSFSSLNGKKGFLPTLVVVPIGGIAIPFSMGAGKVTAASAAVSFLGLRPFNVTLGRQSHFVASYNPLFLFLRVLGMRHIEMTFFNTKVD